MREASSIRVTLGKLIPLLPGVLILLFLFLIPVGLIFPDSLMTKEGFSFSIYGEIASDSFYWSVLFKSCWISFVSMAICLLIGYPLSYYMVRIVNPRYKRIIYMVVIAPLFTSAVVRAMAWIIILGKKGILNDTLLSIGLVSAPVRVLYTNTAIVIGLVYIMIPFMVVTIAAVLENVDGHLEEAARDLGATAWTTFFKVTLPLTAPGVMAGSVFVFALSISSYVTPAMLGGGRIKLFSMLIFEQYLRLFNWDIGASLAFILLVVTLVLIALYNRSVSGGIGQSSARQL
jgi:putative spermidine/putrescine transport system permease protein